MFTDRFLRHRGAKLDAEERAVLEACIAEVVNYAGRQIVERAHDEPRHSSLLMEGIMCRYRDDRRGLRQLVEIHDPVRLQRHAQFDPHYLYLDKKALESGSSESPE